VIATLRSVDPCYFEGEAGIVSDGPTPIGAVEYPAPRQNALPKKVEVWPPSGSQALRNCILMIR
jgi:hypothetical protein